MCVHEYVALFTFILKQSIPQVTPNFDYAHTCVHAHTLATITSIVPQGSSLHFALAFSPVRRIVSEPLGCRLLGQSVCWPTHFYCCFVLPQMQSLLDIFPFDSPALYSNVCLPIFNLKCSAEFLAFLAFLFSLLLFFFTYLLSLF